MEELLARLRAALRRDRQPRETKFRIGLYDIDLAAHTIVPANAQASSAGPQEPLHLTPTEWRLLEVLLAAPGRLVSSSRLLNQIWGPGFERSTHYLRFHMAGLRRKLEDDPHRPVHLLTEPGMGYRYRP
jgi:two-component system, OmpR family, KDP operon response regulator KdpE